MKANELMIGDWIADKDGGKVRVENIINSEFDCYYGIDVVRMNHDGRCSRWTVDFEDAQPIPLTDEILGKNAEGITSRYHKPFEWTWDTSTGWLNINNERNGDYEITFCSDGYPITVIKYVHELQHALRLCGIEKEIEL